MRSDSSRAVPRASPTPSRGCWLARVWNASRACGPRSPRPSAACRIPRPPEFDEAEAVLARVLPNEQTTAVRIDEVLGAVEGLESLSRQAKISKLKDATLKGLRAASGLEGRKEDAEKLARIRRLATLALTASGAVTKPMLDAGAADPDDEVRRLTMLAARADVEGREAVVTKGLADANPRVRYEALQTWGGCSRRRRANLSIKAVRDTQRACVAARDRPAREWLSGRTGGARHAARRSPTA